MIKSEVMVIKKALNKTTEAFFPVLEKLQKSDKSKIACLVRQAAGDAIRSKDSINKVLENFK